LVVRIAVGVVVVLAVAFVGLFSYFEYFSNPRVVRELAEHPDGERARKVMLLTLPSGRGVPVNYLREGRMVYAGADGRWWKELEGEGHRVTVLIRGEGLSGTGRAVLEDPEYTKDVFARLRPNALPGFGTLVEIRLDAPMGEGGR